MKIKKNHQEKIVCIGSAWKMVLDDYEVMTEIKLNIANIFRKL